MKCYGNYAVVVRTTFNPKLGKRGEFTSKDGCGRVSVFNNIGERVYTRRFHKVIWIAPLETKNPEDKIKEFYLGKIPANLKNHFFIFKNRTWYYRTVVCSEKATKAHRRTK